MIQIDIERLSTARAKLAAIELSPEVVALKFIIDELEGKCDHHYPDGISAWREIAFRSATCQICGYYDCD